VSIRRATSMAVVVLIFAGCAPDTDSQPTQPTSVPTPATTSASSPVPSRAPSRTPSSRESDVPATLRFTATTVDGERFNGASLAGKPVLLWFWAPWCPICRGQVSQVEKIASDHEGTLSVVSVGSLDDADAIRSFAEGVTGVTHLLDESGEVWKHFGIKEQSSFVLLDASGTRVYSSGYGGSDQVDQQVADVVR
jgi:thiol-disulfide isomerase/thioredoxin